VAGFPAALLAQTLGLGRGGYALDAACASSLYALYLAVQQLQSGQADAMLAGGCSRPDCLYTQMGFAQLRALSVSGRCAPFDAQADGLLVGEGAAIFVLKRLPDALRDGDTIHAIIRGIGLSNDRTGNLLAPAREGQVRAMRRAYHQAGFPPQEVDYIECHATGTPVGDAVEWSSLCELWGPDRWRPGQCVLSSVKATVGHLLTAAGAAGLAKVVLALKHGQLPPQANFRRPSPQLASYDHAPFRILQQPEPWHTPNGRPRRAAISGFGFGGINAHLIVEQWTGEVTPPLTGAPARRFVPVAIVGLSSHFGPYHNATALLHALRGQHIEPPRRKNNGWNGLTTPSPLGWPIEQLQFPADHFRIPPRELEETLPQQLLMLQLAVEALRDSLPPHTAAPLPSIPKHAATPESTPHTASRSSNGPIHLPPRPVERMGVFIGLELDANTMNFHLRWSALAAGQPELADQLSPPLNANRTMGALGSIVASRIARALAVDGPSFVICNEEASAARAVAIAVQALQDGEIDSALVGGVDLSADPRVVIPAQITQPGEGAAAFVLKRLSDAQRDNDAIYALIVGVGVGEDRDSAWAEALEQAGWCDNPPTATPYCATAIVGHCGAATAAADLAAATLLLATDPPISPADPPIPSTPTPETSSACYSYSCVQHSNQPRRGWITASSCTSHLVLLLQQYGTTRVPRQNQQISAPGRTLHLPVGWTFTPRYLHPQPSIQSVAPPPKNASTTTQPIESPNRMPTTHPIEPSGSTVVAPLMPESLQLAHSHYWYEQLLAAQSAFLQTQQGWLRVATALAQLPLQTLANHQLPGNHEPLANHQPPGNQSRCAPSVPTVVAEQTAVVSLRPSNSLVVPQLDSPTNCVSVADVPRSLDYEQCCRFAAGKIAEVLGPRYALIDTFPTRVRLPDGPLQLVDRILLIEGEPLSLQPGRVVTEHRVHAQRWYLEADRIPTALSVEAGQADLFLSGFLGIDMQTRGQAVYRLLDAVVTFHRGLPRVGETIRYDIAIDQFVRQGDAWLFRFRFDGTVGDQPYITMRHGTAGFFTPAALAAGKGIVQTALDRQPRPGRRPSDWQDLAPLTPTALDEHALEALRQGNLKAAFGPAFADLPLRQPRTLPSGPLRLLHRLPHIDLHGGRFGLGLIRGELDIHPDDWFLICHFVDDPVMPGTLMYECCLQTLRVGLLRLGWIGEADTTIYEPVPGVASRLKCRGQVIPTTRTTTYEVIIKELGYRPEPYCLADALMYADGKPIVEITNLSVQLTGVKREDVERLWQHQRSRCTKPITPLTNSTKAAPALAPPRFVYDSRHIRAFSNGKPSEAFGEPYRIFDQQRVIARLPGPPYQFLDGITAVEGPAFELQPGAKCEAVYDIPPSAWYFEHQRSDYIPFCVLLEIALQPCGWLAAYCGSALYSSEDLSFRNLGGSAIQHRAVTRHSGRLTTQVQLTRVAQAAGMIIEHFTFNVQDAHGPVYSGDTYFGFFTKAALQQQVGLRDAAAHMPQLPITCHRQPFPSEPPFPGPMLRMIEHLECYEPAGGRFGLGCIVGSIPVDPAAWFFQAHFYQDPVWPGSLGLQSLLQLLQYVAQQRWGHLPSRIGATTKFCSGASTGCHTGLGPALGIRHQWTYRGQIIPQSRQVTVIAELSAIDEQQQSLTADGWLLVDGRPIYHMQQWTWTKALNLWQRQSVK
jgi:3-oxoacyl-(acyl-carrier-protein) synthase/3-hydroxymyristoyl/3-hydroxydecanoyl-(acyl carrier protein) dehydratase